MQIKLSESEIITILKEHLQIKNIHAGEIMLQQNGSKIHALVDDAQIKPPNVRHITINGLEGGINGGSMKWNQEPSKVKSFYENNPSEPLRGGTGGGGFKENLKKEDVTEKTREELSFLSGLSQILSPEKVELHIKELKNGQAIDWKKMTDLLSAQLHKEGK